MTISHNDEFGIVFRVLFNCDVLILRFILQFSFVSHFKMVEIYGFQQTWLEGLIGQKRDLGVVCSFWTTTCPS